MGSDEKPTYRVLQVSNISTQATKDQVYQLFQYLGRIQEFRLYPSDVNVTSSTTQKFAYIRYEDEKSVELGQHLTNVALIDRALLCVPSVENVIPDEMTALNMGGPPLPGQRVLPPHVVNKTQEIEGQMMLLTVDPTLDQLGLPQYPPLPATTEPSKVEEIRRTVYVGNLPKGVNPQDVLDYFNMTIGEVMYLRMTAGRDALPCEYAFVEFSSQNTVAVALQNNMMLDYEGRILRIVHSRVAIVKPQQKTADQALEEIEEAIKKKDSGISYFGARSRSRSTRRDRDVGGSRARSPPRRERVRSRTRSPDRRPRRRSPSPPRRDRDRGDRDRRRSRSRDRGGDRDRSDRDRRVRRSRSRDRDRERRRSGSKSRDRKKSRSRSKDRKRSRSRDAKDRKDRDRSRDRDRKKDKKEKDKKRSRSRSPKKDKKRDRDRSTERSSRKEKKEKKKDKDKDRDSDDEASIRERLLQKVAARKSDAEDDKELNLNGDVPTKISHQRKRKHTGGDSDSE